MLGPLCNSQPGSGGLGFQHSQLAQAWRGFWSETSGAVYGLLFRKSRCGYVSTSSKATSLLVTWCSLQDFLAFASTLTSGPHQLQNAPKQCLMRCEHPKSQTENPEASKTPYNLKTYSPTSLKDPQPQKSALNEFRELVKFFQRGLDSKPELYMYIHSKPNNPHTKPYAGFSVRGLGCIFVLGLLNPKP